MALDRAQCLEFAIGSIAAVLGHEYAPIDGHPTRVRLPDEPLMLVDRIVTIEGEPRSLSSGRVVTEHDILAGDWYLDAGRIPPCIAIESGQADLFLSGYLGIDFVTKGLAVYRLLDATVTFHRGLPGPGEVDPLRHQDHAVSSARAIRTSSALSSTGPSAVNRSHHARRLRGVLLGRGAGRRQGHRSSAP